MSTHARPGSETVPTHVVSAHVPMVTARWHLVRQVMEQLDEARGELEACEASKADEERANAGLAAAMRAAERERDEARADVNAMRSLASAATESRDRALAERDEARAVVDALRTRLAGLPRPATPGPWREDGWDDALSCSTHGIRGGEGGRDVVLVTSPGCEMPPDVDDGDADAICALPDVWAALIEAGVAE